MQQEQILKLGTIENIRELAGNVIVGEVKYDEVHEVTNCGWNFLADGLWSEIAVTELLVHVISGQSQSEDEEFHDWSEGGLLVVV